MSLRVLITCKQMQAGMERFRAQLAEHDIAVDMPPVVQQLDERELLEVIAVYDGVIAGDDSFTADVIDAARRLRVISKWGVGLDNIDLAAAAARGIAVTNTPGVFADAVADVALGYVISLGRRLHLIDRLVREGGWPRLEGESLQGKTIGLVGFGTIGRALAGRAAACKMNVVTHDVDPAAREVAHELGVETPSLPELLRQSRFVVLVCALTPENRRIIGRNEFAALQPGSYLVNVARGALVDEDALVDALASGQLGGAALDVFEKEPLPLDARLRDLPSCILGSHNSSNASDAVIRTNDQAFENLLLGLAREPL